MRPRAALLLAMCTCASTACSTTTAPRHGSAHDLAVYEGLYEFPDGAVMTVAVQDGALSLDLIEGNLFRFSDNRVDARVLALEDKTRQLMQATLAGDRARIAELFGSSPGAMDAAVADYLELMAEPLAAHRGSARYEVVATIYRDEDSDHGFEDAGWGWQTFVRFDGEPDDVMVRIVWDGVTGDLMHRGLGGEPPAATRLRFLPRAPARSWLRAYDPQTQTTRRLRDVESGMRPLMTPARFVAYDVDTHQTMGLRFRRETQGEPMRLELGPLGSEILAVARRTNP